MLKILLGAALGAVAMFIWGFVFWGLLPFGSATVQSVDNQVAAQQVLAATFVDSGTYMVPNGDPDDAEFQSLHKAGPIAFVHFRSAGSDPMAPGTFVMGLLHVFVVLLLMGLAVSRIAAGFGLRLAVVVLAGLAGSLNAEFAGPIWWMHPWAMALTNVFYQTVGWVLGGAILCAILSRQAAKGQAR